MNCSPAIWQQQYEVRTREVDTAGRLKLSAIADYLQEAAAHHTHHVQIGLYQLKPHNLTWILSRLRINIIRYPTWGEKLTVTTWPKGDNHLAAARDFRITDQRGQPVAAATSIWFLLDLHTFKPRPIAVLPTPFHVDRTLPEAIAEAPGKVPSVASELKPALTSAPQPSDIDINGHLNNACYFDWLANSLAPETPPFAQVDINYLAEVKLGDTVALKVDRHDDFILIEGIDHSSNRSAFRTRLGF